MKNITAYIIPNPYQAKPVKFEDLSLREKCEAMEKTKIGYVVKDRNTGCIIRKYKAHQGPVARRFADKKDNEYGAYRYTAIAVYAGDENARFLEA